MDNQLIQLIARLKIQFRKEKGLQINTQRFFDDAAYRIAVLDEADTAESEELITLAITLRDRLGMIAQPAGNVPVPVPASTTPVPVPAARADKGETRNYKFGARSW
ncbi:hypothetical protein [Uliginosibacterium sp. H1]|uniref:hypothetical protein n=1 Tax=Uliginosibacterium sp. H1 TaxID=3114757 RepID=UPI002E176A54|nr:hypothetical protein [Uliginosibacterium sp. H1]